MNIQELQTIATSNKPILIIVLNNNGYLSIKQTHENFFGKIVGATPDTGIEFPDFTKVANALGIPATTIDISNYFALPKILTSNGPHLINIIVDPDQGFAPRLKARLNDQGQFEPLQLDDMFPYLEQNEVNQVRISAQNIKSTIK
jgi:acetolactate synthase-1/2/3 large subunit